MNTTTKKELIAAVIANGITNPFDAQKAVETTLDAIATALASGNRVELRNFGVFHVHTTPARPSNLIAGMTIPATSKVKFAAGKELGQRVASIAHPQN